MSYIVSQVVLRESRKCGFQQIKSSIQPNKQTNRTIATSSVIYGRRNFRKFPIPNKRGIFEHPKLPKEFLQNEYDFPVAIDDMRIRYPGVWFGKKFVYVREMEPDIVVPPNFEECTLKPYVSYTVDEINQSEFTAKQLFNATYGQEIFNKHKNKEPISETMLQFDEKAAEEAKVKALKTGTDLFSHSSYFGNLK